MMLERLFAGIAPDSAFLVRRPDGRLLSVNGAREADGGTIVHVRRWRALAAILARPGLALGEAYMDGDLVVERGDLYRLLLIGARSARKIARRRPPPARIDTTRSRRNVAHHYDLSRDFFRLFLDDDLQYSCAYYADPRVSLEAAQIAKKRHLAAKLLLSPGQRVLDIGSGWGGLALTLAQDWGADVTGVTLSTEQLQEARERALRAGLDDRVRFALQDYRDVQLTYDRIVSVGMFEHVGPAQYDAYLGAVHRLLDERGVALLHTIGRFEGAGQRNPWIEKYIFPGGYIPALSEIMTAVERSGLILTDVEVLRLHYAETLRAWRTRFAARRDEARAMYDERFCRMWEFYLTASEASFREGSLVVLQLQLAKDRTVVPQTRDYIAAAERMDAQPPTRVAAE